MQDKREKDEVVGVNKMLPCDFAPHNQWKMAYTAVNAEPFWW